jgi:mycofactocin system glycosyltransferase
MRVVSDPGLHRLSARVWTGGSPMRMFRVTPAGDDLLAKLDAEGVLVVNGGAAKRLLARLVSAGAAHPVPEASDLFTGADVTAVVVVRDNAEGIRSLADLVGSVRRVVVVDDGSADAEQHRAAVAAIGAEYLRLDVARGPAAARNAGLEVVGTGLVAFVDSDVVVGPDWLSPLLAHFDDPAVEAVAPRVVSRHGEGRLAAYEEVSSPLDMGELPAIVRPGSTVSHVPSAALLARVRTVEELGGFDEALRYGEDVDLLWRICADAGVVRYDPRSSVLHEPREKWVAWAQQRMGYGSSAAPLAARHPENIAPAVLTPWSAGVWLSTIGGSPIRGVLTALGSAFAFARKADDVPAPDAVRLVLVGHLAAGRQVAKACVREWWPVMLVGSLFSRRIRRIWGLALVLRLATDPRKPADRVIGVVDDMAYGAGVWRGVIRQRSLRAVLPRIRRT